MSLWEGCCALLMAGACDFVRVLSPSPHTNRVLPYILAYKAYPSIRLSPHLWHYQPVCIACCCVTDTKVYFIWSRNTGSYLQRRDYSITKGVIFHPSRYKKLKAIISIDCLLCGIQIQSINIINIFTGI